MLAGRAGTRVCVVRGAAHVCRGRAGVPGTAIPIVRERDGKAARCGRRQRRTQPPSAKATNYSHVAFEMKANLYKAPVNLSHLSFSGFFDGKYHLNVNVTENWVCAKALTGAFMELLK